MELEGSLLHSPQPAAGPFPEPDQPSPHPMSSHLISFVTGS
jgi:hypothetical protein